MYLQGSDAFPIEFINTMLLVSTAEFLIFYKYEKENNFCYNNWVIRYSNCV